MLPFINNKPPKTRSRFVVMEWEDAPEGLPMTFLSTNRRYGLIESTDGSFVPVVFYTKAAWPLVEKQLTDSDAESEVTRLKELVLQSELPESISELDHIMLPSRTPAQKKPM